MVLLNFSFTGENTTGAATFAIANEYKFKTCLLKDVKYTIAGEDLFEQIGAVTSGDGQSMISTTISSPLALHCNFLDTKDCVLYSLGDGSGETLNTVQNVTGLIPIGVATGSANGVAVSDGSTISHSYPYTLINNRPQTWSVGKSIIFTLYYRDVRTDGIIKDWAAMSTLTDAFNDMCSIDITLELI